MPLASWTFAYCIDRRSKRTVRSTASGNASDPGRANAIAVRVRFVSKSMNVTWQNAA